MECVDPWMKGLEAYRCGKCESCRRYQRRVLTTRLYLEAGLHDVAAFVTLTYAEDPWSLEKRSVQLFLKRYRALVSPLRVRYLAVGEYGSLRSRPHYHLILFGPAGSISAQQVGRCWPEGFVQVGSFSLASAMYVAGYVLKKGVSTEVKCSGRVPEFTLRSLKPGLGYGCADVLASFYKTRVGQEEFCAQGDVAGGIRIDGGIWPLGNYLRTKVRSLAGLEVARGHFRALKGYERAKVVQGASSELLQHYLAECAARRGAIGERLKLRRSYKGETL